MMINWFVIHNSEHLGPFSEEVLHQLFSEGDIEQGTLIWKEGMDDSISYEEAFLFKKEELSFRPIEETIDTKFETENFKQIKKEEQAIADDDLPPDLPPEIFNLQKIDSEHIAIEVEESIELVEDQEEIEEIEDTPVLIKKKKTRAAKSSKSYQYIIATLIMIILIPGAIFIKISVLKFKRPAKMSLHDYERLTEVSSDPALSNKYSFAMAKDKSTLWMSTNLPYSGDLVISMKSVTGKVLSPKKISLQTRGILNNKIATFSDFTFLEGLKLVDGYYEVEVSTTNDLEKPLITKFLHARKRQFRFFEVVLISNMDKSEFEILLQKNYKKAVSNDLEFWKELKQKYKTIQMITLQIQNSLKQVYDNPEKEWGEKVQHFEMDYKVKFGNFFTNFVIANDKSYEALKNKNFSNKLEIISNYTRLSRLARNIGSQTMSILNDLETFNNNLSLEEFKVSRKKSLNRLQNIINICNQKIEMIQTK